MTSTPASEMKVLMAAQQAVVRWRRVAPTASFERVITEVEHEWWPEAAGCLAQRRAFREFVTVLQSRSDYILTDLDPLLALVRQTLASEHTQ